MISMIIKEMETAFVLPPTNSFVYSGDPTGHFENDLVDVDDIVQAQNMCYRLEFGG